MFLRVVNALKSQSLHVTGVEKGVVYSHHRGGEVKSLFRDRLMFCAETFSASMKLLNLKCSCAAAFVFFLNIKLIKLLNEAGSCNCRVESKSVFMHSHYPVMAVTLFSKFLFFFFYLSLFSFNLCHQCSFKIRPKGGLRTQMTDSSAFVSHWQAPP